MPESQHLGPNGFVVARYRTAPSVHVTSSSLVISSYSIVKVRGFNASLHSWESVTATANAEVGRDAPSKRSSAARLLPLWTLSSTSTTMSDFGIGSRCVQTQ